MNDTCGYSKSKDNTFCHFRIFLLSRSNVLGLKMPEYAPRLKNTRLAESLPTARAVQSDGGSLDATLGRGETILSKHAFTQKKEP